MAPSRSLANTGTAATDRLREQFAPQATDEDLAYFAEVCRHLDVDPWAGHIALMGWTDTRTGAMVHRPTLTVAGRRFIAQRTGHLRGIQGPEWCGPRSSGPDGTPGDLVWSELWDGEGVPYAARCFVFRDDWDRPANGTTKWSEFAQTFQPKGGGDRRPKGTWAQMPSHMLGKCAEALALRRAFPEVASAVAYIGDEDVAMAAEVVAAVSDLGPAADDAGPVGGELTHVGRLGPDFRDPDDPREADRLETVRAMVDARRPDAPEDFPPPDPPDRAAALQARLEGLPDGFRLAFRSWQKSQRCPPPREVTDPDVLDAIAATLERLEQDAAADVNAYGTADG